MTEEFRTAATPAIGGFRRREQVGPDPEAAILELTDQEAAEVEVSAR